MTETNYISAAPACACGNAITKFFKSGKPGKFCSSCRSRQSAKPRQDSYSVDCFHCGREFSSPLATGPRRRYCSAPCKAKANAKEWVALGEREFKCACCNGAFKAERARKYCSTSCKWRAQTLQRKPDSAPRAAPIDRTCTCKGCGVQYQNKRGGTSGEGSEFCSRQCAFAAKASAPSCSIWFGECKGCGRAFVSPRKRVYCSDACHAKPDYISLVPGLKVCRCCGDEYKPASTGGRPSEYCGPMCVEAVAAEVRRVARSKRKALIRGVSIEDVDPYVVFDRDKWRCQLCHTKTPKAKRGTYDDNAPELDHIITLSEGGEHSYRNTQCACRKCNGAKSGRSMGQLLLIG